MDRFMSYPANRSARRDSSVKSLVSYVLCAPDHIPDGGWLSAEFAPLGPMYAQSTEKYSTENFFVVRLRDQLDREKRCFSVLSRVLCGRPEASSGNFSA